MYFGHLPQGGGPSFMSFLLERNCGMRTIISANAFSFNDDYVIARRIQRDKV
jgi:hypothetical protein